MDSVEQSGCLAACQPQECFESRRHRGPLRVARVLAEELSSQRVVQRALVLLLLLVMMRVMVVLLRCRGGRLGALLLRLRRAQVRVPDHRVDVHPLVLPVSQALSDEGLGGVRHGRLVGEVDLRGFENDVLLQDSGLGLVVTERLQEKTNCSHGIFLLSHQWGSIGARWRYRSRNP